MRARIVRAWDFLKVRKRYWLVPPLVIIFAIAAFVALTDVSIGVDHIYFV